MPDGENLPHQCQVLARIAAGTRDVSEMTHDGGQDLPGLDSSALPDLNGAGATGVQQARVFRPGFRSDGPDCRSRSTQPEW
jgi:hypothetical protein